MSGGNKGLVFNTRERAVSDDVNRLQSFGAYDRAETWRRLVNQRVVDGTTLGGGVLELGSFVNTLTNNDQAPIDTPLRADVFDGLTVMPQLGSLNLLVLPGACGLDDPDGQTGSSDPNPPNPDDSRYKMVVDPGVLIVGALTIGAGAGGTRIDVIECQRTTVVVETDSRDVFDPSTGVFIPVTVNKVVEGRLVYRVRSGTPGGGFPGAVQGWLPLCVASVPSSATVVDAMTFWDVRPLVKDRVNGGLDSSRLKSDPTAPIDVFGNDFTVSGHTNLYGFAETTLNSYRAGGIILSPANVPFDVTIAANQETGFAPVASQPWYLYAVFPAGLPRWVRYQTLGGILQPNGPLGILTVSTIDPVATYFYKKANAITVSASTGLLVPGQGALLLAGLINATPKPGGFAVQPHNLIMCSIASIGGNALAPAVSNAASDRYDLTAGIHYPKGARSVVVRVIREWTGLTAGDAFNAGFTPTVVPPGSSTPNITNAAGSTFASMIVPPGGAVQINGTVEVPVLFSPSNTIGGADDCSVYMLWGSATTPALKSLTVVGWRF